MQKTYEPTAIEAHWYPLWENAGYFKPSGHGTPYCICLPPPNVTGSLHMGHSFQQTLMDILIRYHRMLGDNVLWQGGTDHAGIATQMVVERNLLQEGISRHDLGREKFVEKIWEWKKTSGDRISKQMARLGLSIDWSRQRFTMDEGLSEAVQKVFIDLYREGLIYRGKRLVNWDCKLRTAVSDLEVEYSEEEGSLWHIRYPLLEDETKHIVIATTRPETLLGDVALAVNPKDERYQHLIGKQVRVPLTTKTIPIIADDYVEKEFGSGVVKITPGHDFNDYAVGQRHKLPIINILNDDGSLNNEVPKEYQGLDRFEARKKVVSDLTTLKLIEKIEKHLNKVPRGDRSQSILEPYLTDQWFVKTDTIGKVALDVVKNKKIQFVPEHWENTYFRWMENLQDWCISRQLWWGHRIPAWYDEANQVYVGKNEAEVRKHYQLNNSVILRQDVDVLDTWFSSALWPFSTLGWPQETNELTTFYPGNVLITGFDIIFFWVARMVMFGMKFMDNIPFKHVYIHGLVRDAEGQKMSKTKGNVLDPLDVIDGISLPELISKRTQGLMQPAMAKRIEEETKRQYPQGIASYGTDALRFTFCALASTTRDINFDLARVEGYRNFCNKLWNAARFVFMNLENTDKPFKPKEFNLIDRYILSRLQTTISDCHRYLADYRYDLMANSLYEFVWNEYCDWYLELVKPILQNSRNTENKNASCYTLLYVLDQICRLLHPIMPFITEEIWQKVKLFTDAKEESIMISNYPKVISTYNDEQAVSSVQWLKELVISIRTIRSQSMIPPSKKLSVYLSEGSKKDHELFEQFKLFISNLARLDSISWGTNSSDELTASGLCNGMKIAIPLSDVIDLEQEKARLEKEIIKITKELERCEAKLNNESYVAKAPKEVVEKEREKAKEFEEALKKLREQLT